MSFFSNLFKRKPGGTVVGNLLRTVGNAIAPGVLGTGAMMIKPDETPAQSDARLAQGLGAGVVAAVNQANNPAPVYSGASTLQEFAQQAQTGAVDQLWQKYKSGILIGFAAIAALIYFKRRK